MPFGLKNAVQTFRHFMDTVAFTYVSHTSYTSAYVNARRRASREASKYLPAVHVRDNQARHCLASFPGLGTRLGIAMFMYSLPCKYYIHVDHH